MRFKVLIGLSAALMAIAASATGALAYTTGPGTTGTTTTTTPTPGTPFTTTFTFTDASGNAIAGLLVTFKTASGPSGCTAVFGSATGVTNAAGQVSTSVTIPSNCSGAFTLAAVGAGGETATVSVTAGAASGGTGFPNTSAVPAQLPVLPILSVLVGIALVVVAGFGLSRTRRTSALPA